VRVLEGFAEVNVAGWAASVMNASPYRDREGACEDFLARLLRSKQDIILSLV
jgi:hypothetical protein